MSAFAELQKAVIDGEIRVVHIDAVPRSMSTVLGRALAECSEGGIYINEPFNKFNHNIDAAAVHLVDAAETHKTDDEFVIITKSIARSIQPEDFDRWMSICDGLVWSIRDPRLQIGSLLTRVVNDVIVEHGADDLTDEDVYKNMAHVVKSEFEPQNFSQTAWAAIRAHADVTTLPHKQTAVDGSRLVVDPEGVLSVICDRIGLTYDDCMVHKWKKPFVNANTGHDKWRSNGDIPSSAWVHKALSSNNFQITHREPLDMDLVPASVRSHIMNVALPTYRRLVEL